MKTVFILGAGASCEAGAPLMTDFFKRARKIYDEHGYGDVNHHIKDVLNAGLIDLKLVQVKSNIKTQNIEHLFSAVDIGQLIGVFGTRPPHEIDSLRESIVVFIQRTIEETVRVPFSGRRFAPPKGYDILSKLVLEKVRKTAPSGRNDVSFISFNYDTCLEYSLSLCGIGVDYGLGEPFCKLADNNAQVKLPVLKLHGSINWATCPKCNAIVPTELNPFGGQHLIDTLDLPDALKLSYHERFRLNTHKCGSGLSDLPVIVPPTWNKASVKYGGLREVWKRAAKELASAENIVVIGYSMPPTDMFFNYLFALGSDSDAHLEKFVVIDGSQDPKWNTEIERRFKSLLGPTSIDGFAFHPFIFSGSEVVLKSILDT